MNKFLNMDKDNFFYSILMLVLLSMVVLPLLSCNRQVRPHSNGSKYSLTNKKQEPKKKKTIKIQKIQ